MASRLQALADGDRDSPARRFRARRNLLFRSLVDRLPRPVRLLDVGGTERFWKNAGLLEDRGFEITLINVEPEPTSGAVVSLEGDARDLSRFGDGAFDVAFSNSTIEHVGSDEDQLRTAREIQRVGRAYFVQTPNRMFPIEPHFLFPGFQFLPMSTRVFLLTHLNLGWCGKVADRATARRYAEGVRLLDRAAFRACFPAARIWDERVAGLVKSFVAYGGFPEAEA